MSWLSSSAETGAAPIMMDLTELRSYCFTAGCWIECNKYVVKHSIEGNYNVSPSLAELPSEEPDCMGGVN